jgi:hypothetical protein
MQQAACSGVLRDSKKGWYCWQFPHHMVYYMRKLGASEAYGKRCRLSVSADPLLHAQQHRLSH